MRVVCLLPFHEWHCLQRVEITLRFVFRSSSSFNSIRSMHSRRRDVGLICQHLAAVPHLLINALFSETCACLSLGMCSLLSDSCPFVAFSMSPFRFVVGGADQWLLLAHLLCSFCIRSDTANLEMILWAIGYATACAPSISLFRSRSVRCLRSCFNDLTFIQTCLCSVFEPDSNTNCRVHLHEEALHQSSTDSESFPHIAIS